MGGRRGSGEAGKPALIDLFPASPLPRLPALLADLVVVIHFSFVLFVILGGLLVLRRPRLAYVHLPAAAWGVLIELTGWICPLTPLEQSLRLKAGEQGYSGSFIEHYVLPLLYPSALTRNIQLLLGCLVLGLNLGIYGYLLYRRAENSTSVTRPRSGDSRS